MNYGESSIELHWKTAQDLITKSKYKLTMSCSFQLESVGSYMAIATLCLSIMLTKGSLVIVLLCIQLFVTCMTSLQIQGSYNLS